ncbi:MAG: FHA domain-containing protein [Janthinobacterium lividum]
MPPLLILTVLQSGSLKEFRLSAASRIGRADDCEISLQDQHVSRVHARVLPEGDTWWIEDLNSSNGLIVQGARVTRIPLSNGSVVRLGVHGLDLNFYLQATQPVPAPVALSLPSPVISPATLGSAPSSAKLNVERYFGKLQEGDTAGEHTMFIRSAFAQVQSKQKRKFGGVILSLCILMVALAGFGLLQYRKANRQRQIAEQMFYSVKGLDVEIANLQEAVNASGSPQMRNQLRAIEDQRVQMEDSYNTFLASMHIYEPGMKEQDRLILRVARIFGECEVDMPKDFKSEVERYIKYWQSSTRYASNIRTATQNGYTDRIAREMVRQNLPPQFFYLAMQESDFKADVSGPVTGVGIPKGMWQFMPATAIHYGLKLGPLLDEQLPDGKDERTNYERETEAAGKYLKDLYGKDAEASGLLVMACYNWGQPQVLRLVRTLPPNPRDRNFWKLMKQHREQVPKETYDYVFRIVAAAVIGENPRLFGFDFDNPLAKAQASNADAQN